MDLALWARYRIAGWDDRWNLGLHASFLNLLIGRNYDAHDAYHTCNALRRIRAECFCSYADRSHPTRGFCSISSWWHFSAIIYICKQLKFSNAYFKIFQSVYVRISSATLGWARFQGHCTRRRTSQRSWSKISRYVKCFEHQYVTEAVRGKGQLHSCTAKAFAGINQASEIAGTHMFAQ